MVFTYSASSATSVPSERAPARSFWIVPLRLPVARFSSRAGERAAHRPAGLAGERDRDVRVVAGPVLRAEAAAHVVADHAHAVGRQLELPGDRVADPPDELRRDVDLERVAFPAGRPTGGSPSSCAGRSACGTRPRRPRRPRRSRRRRRRARSCAARPRTTPAGRPPRGRAAARALPTRPRRARAPRGRARSCRRRPRPPARRGRAARSAARGSRRARRRRARREARARG